MADGRLQVILDAEADKFIAEIKRAQAEIEKLEGRIVNLSGSGAKGLKKELKLLNAELRGFRAEVKQANTGLKQQAVVQKQVTATATKAVVATKKLGQAQTQLRSQVGASNAVALEFNRILQDAPFGIVGVGNNIQQLVAQFSNLRAGGQTASQALSASFKALVSPVNLLLLGISAVTALWTAYEIGALDSLKATLGLNEEVEDLTDSLEEYVEALDDVNKARIEGRSSGEKELRTLKELQTQAENTNLPLNVRLEAVRDLKKEYPDYLGTMTDEQILLGNVGNAYDTLSKSIIATAKAKAFSNAIGDKAIEIFTLEERQLDRVNKILEKTDELERLKRRQDNQASGRGAVTGLDLQVLELEKELFDLRNEQVADVEAVNKSRAETLALEARINAELEKGGKFTETIVDETEKLTKAKEKLIGIEGLLRSIGSQFRSDDLFNEALGQIPTPEFTPNLGVDAILEQVEALQKADAEIFKLQENLNKLAKSEGLDVLTGGIRDFANSLVDSFDLSNQALEGFLNALISSIPQFIGALQALSQAKKAKAQADLQADIQSATGNVVVSATESARLLGPVGLFALPALIGFGLNLLSGAFKKPVSGGGGGASSAGQNVAPQAGLTGGGAGGFGDFNLTSSIRGTDLVLLIDRTKAGNT